MIDPLDRPDHDDLQLKKGEHAARFAEVLHGNMPNSWDQLFLLMDALDFVVSEWEKSMAFYGFAEEASETATDILMKNATTRYAIYSFLDIENEEKCDFVEVMKELNGLKQCYVDLAKSYAKDPLLSHWYLNLPLKVAGAFKAIRQSERIESLKEDLSNAEARSELFK
tara:strand:- start:297 stop:800 length:504 start_codon:yes stop_codon:yes gene_type:complete